MEEELLIKAREFDKTNKKEIQEAWKQLEQFLELFPFQEHPEKINELSSEKIYTPGDKTAFLYWPEFGLKDLGRLGAYNLSTRKMREIIQKNSRNFYEKL